MQVSDAGNTPCMYIIDCFRCVSNDFWCFQPPRAVSVEVTYLGILPLEIMFCIQTASFSVGEHEILQEKLHRFLFRKPSV